MKRFLVVLLAAIAILALASGAAYANFGPHGGYATDTDACAGCHRAHTSFSSLGWTNRQGEEHASALLVSNASTMSQFCYACHGDAAPGASTNVESGRFDAGPTVAFGQVPNPAAGTLYASNSSFDATLNGGGFDAIGPAATEQPVQSTHGMEAANAPTWGDIVNGIGTPGVIANFRCTSCHDPHGSSNYRLLKDEVNGRVVGGYSKTDPTPYVVSNEEGYPEGGWLRGEMGAPQIAGYKPNYTTPEYANSAPNTGGTMADWCAACHTAYIIENDNDPNVADGDSNWEYAATGEYNYGEAERKVLADGSGPGGLIGALPRHRHPINVQLSQGQGSERALNVEVRDDAGLPLEMAFDAAKTAAGRATVAKPWTNAGYISCLTCHRAHGTQAAMSGWARAELAEPNGAPRPNAAREGVNPNFSEALLRYDNRGVCERCHDK